MVDTQILAVKLVRDPGYGERAHSCTPCAICGRELKPGTRVAWIHMNVSNEVVPYAAELAQDNDMGCFPVGLACLRRHPELKALVSFSTLPGMP